MELLELIIINEDIYKNFTRLHQIRDDVLKALEEARQDKVIGKSLEAHVLLHVSDEDKKLLEDNFGTKINQWLIVSKVTLTLDELNKYEVCEVKVEKADGVVCPRCWNITESKNEEGLCDRCVEVLKDLAK